MSYLQEIRISETAPNVGSTVEPNLIFIVPITDKVCDQYVSDNDGIVRATSIQVPLFTSMAEANLAIPLANRFEGKTIIIEKTFNYTNNEGEQTVQRIYNEYWWRNGIEDANLILKSGSLNATVENGNLINTGSSFGFSGDGVDPDVNLESLSGNNDDIEKPVLLSGGKQSLDVIFGKMIMQKVIGGYNSNPFTGLHVAIGHRVFEDLEYGGECVAIGNAVLNNSKKAQNIVAIGAQTLSDFLGDDETIGTVVNGFVNYHNIVAIGYFAGRGLKQGSGSVYIGSCVGNRPKVETHKLVIHSSDKGTNYEDNPASEFYPLIDGSFKKHDRYFAVAGDIRISKNHNPNEDNLSGKVAILKEVESNGHPHFEIKPMDEKEFVLQTVEALTDEQKKRFKTALGI